MNILFDLVSTQACVGGAQEYVRKVFFALHDILNSSNENIHVFAALDFSINNFAYEDLNPLALKKLGVETADLSKEPLSELVKRLSIDTVFIGVGQFWGEKYNVQNLKCRVICVLHDLCDQECIADSIKWYLLLKTPYIFFKKIVRRILGKDRFENRLNPIIKLAKSNKNSLFVTVSRYSLYSILFHLPIEKNRIKVFFSPERIFSKKSEIENEILKALVEKKKKYFLMINANRILKNANKAIRAFEKFVEKHPDFYFVTIGFPKSENKNHVILPYLSESDLANAFENCYAFVFPSFFEGFGYPPVEAMKFGKPVLCSNVTSMPEIMGNVPIWFSPIYTVDIYSAFEKLLEKDYESISIQSVQKYEEISIRQKNDLLALLALIMNKKERN